MPPILIELCLLLLPMQSDPVRAHEIWQAHARASAVINAGSLQSTAAAALQKKEFEDRFNRLTQAVEEFSREYNKYHGMTWPKDKADALRKAIHDLEEAEPSLRR